MYKWELKGERTKGVGTPSPGTYPNSGWFRSNDFHGACVYVPAN